MKVRKVLLIVSTLIGCAVLVCHHVSGLSYQSEADVEFTFNAELSLSIQGDIVLNLQPGTYGSSSGAYITVSTTSAMGAEVKGAIDDSSTSNLVASGVGVFENVSSSVTLANMPEDRWGWAIDDDNYYNRITHNANGTGTGWMQIWELISDGSDTFNFKIGAKASATKAPGTYTATIKFAAVIVPYR